MFVGADDIRPSSFPLRGRWVFARTDKKSDEVFPSLWYLFPSPYGDSFPSRGSLLRAPEKRRRSALFGISGATAVKKEHLALQGVRKMRRIAPLARLEGFEPPT